MKATLDEMETFITVVDTGSIRTAAETLSITPSAVSRTISRLETKLETTLLNRTTRKLDVTSEGITYLYKVRQILEDVESAELQLQRQKQTPAGILRINAATPFLLHVITPCIASYQERYPEVEIELSSNEENIDLVGKKVDIAFRIGQLKNSTLRATFLGNSRIRVVASPSYLKKAGTPKTIKELLRHKLLGFSKPEVLKDWPLLDEHDKLLKVSSNLRADNGETIRSLALNGAGIACLSDFLTYEDRKAGRLIELFKTSSIAMQQPIHAVYYKNTSTSARITSFINFIKSQLKTKNSEFL